MTVEAGQLGGFRPPPAPALLVHRDRVLKELSRSAAPVICVQAPGGYGKTTALAQWLQDDPRPSIWLTVRPAAADPQWLAQSLMDAMHASGLSREHPTLSGSVETTTWHLNTLPAVERALATSEPFVLVIDDAGALSGDPWEHLVASLANSLPPGSQMALATRDEIPAPLWRVHSRGDVAVIGPDMLAFDRAETGRVMGSLGAALDDEQLRRVTEITHGWPVAVYLVGLSARDHHGSGSWPGSAAGVAGLSEYLRHEIVGPLSYDDSAFLHCVSVLSSLDAQACDSLSGNHDSLARLRRLAEVNHLLAPQDADRTQFRMHPLLADFLSDELRARDPDTWRVCHKAASAVDEAHGDLDGAVHHAKLAHDDQRLADLVWSHAPMHLASGQWALLKRWIDGLDEKRLAGRCGLALSAAWVASHVGDMNRMGRLALAARDAATAGQPSCLPDVELLEATIGAGGLSSIEETSRRFIASKPAEDPWQTVSHYLLGITLMLRDEPQEALTALGEGYDLSQAMGLPVMSAHCLAGMADVEFDGGDRHRGLTHVHEARALAAGRRMETIATAAPIFTTSAVGYVLEGRYADARDEANRALRLTALMRHMVPWHAVGGRLALAQVYLALGDPQRATVLVDEADDYRRPGTQSPRLDRLFTDMRNRVSRASSTLLGASSLTTAEVRVLQYLPTHLSFPEIADELFVSRHTVKTQALSAYRKLGAHSRTEAIHRARKAGLLPE